MSPLPTLPPSSAAQFFHEVRDLPCDRLEAVSQAFQPIPTMDLMEPAIASVIEQSKVHRASAFIPRGTFLFYGPAGGGKTTVAGVLAHRWARTSGCKAKLARLNAHALASGEHGQSQKNVGRLFKALRELCEPGDPVFATIDEFETLATNRDEISGKTSPIDARNSVNCLLEQLDQRPRNLLLFATTNVSKYLDHAVIDRFDFAFLVPLPNAEARLKALSTHLKALSPNNRALEGASRVQLRSLADLTDGWSFRAMERLVRTCIAIYRGILSPDIQQLLVTAKFLKNNAALLKGGSP